MRFSILLYAFVATQLLGVKYMLAQDSAVVEHTPKLKVSGYIKSLSTVAMPQADESWKLDNLLHNRINAKWDAGKSVTVTGEMRNRLFYGNSIVHNPDYSKQVIESEEFVGLGGKISKGKSYMLHATLDRLYVDWFHKEWQVRVGKQRINWGKSYVWNPNDIFNAYSFVDFDYEERRGTDAIMLKRVFDDMSAELAFSAAENFEETVLAAKYSYSKNQYDFQYIIGKYKQDVVVGMGWAGQIGSAGFKGELSYFKPYKKSTVADAFVGNVSFDYTFPNTLALRSEVLWNSSPQQATGSLLFTPVTARNLSFDKVSAFISAGYDINPLIKANVNAIWYVNTRSYLANPNVTFSVSENLEFLLAVQSFGGGYNSMMRALGNYVFTRFKWNF